MYKLSRVNGIFGMYESIIRLSDNAQIPLDEANTDYQAYLKWVADGNTPLPAENT
jgi:hypothetical protein